MAAYELAVKVEKLFEFAGITGCDPCVQVAASMSILVGELWPIADVSWACSAFRVESFI
jgi:hypothetical protein